MLCQSKEIELLIYLSVTSKIKSKVVSKINNEKITIGEYIKRIRLEKGLTSRKLAEKSSVSQPYISQLETGKNTNPSIEIIVKIAEALDIDPIDLLKNTGYFVFVFDDASDNCHVHVPSMDKNQIAEIAKEQSNKITTNNTKNVDISYELKDALNHLNLQINGRTLTIDEKNKLLKIAETMFSE